MPHAAIFVAFVKAAWRSLIFLSILVRGLSPLQLGFEASRSRAILGRVRKQGGDGHELSMAGAVTGDVCGIHASRNNLAIVHEDAANGSFVCSEREAGLAE
jgi:hypothetical protein